MKPEVGFGPTLLWLGPKVLSIPIGLVTSGVKAVISETFQKKGKKKIFRLIM